MHAWTEEEELQTAVADESSSPQEEAAVVGQNKHCRLLLHGQAVDNHQLQVASFQYWHAVQVVGVAGVDHLEMVEVLHHQILPHLAVAEMVETTSPKLEHQMRVE